MLAMLPILFHSAFNKGWRNGGLLRNPPHSHHDAGNASYFVPLSL